MRAIPDPGFAGDDGSQHPAVGAALAAYGADPARRGRETLAVLQDARLLVPVVAVLGDVEVDDRGLRREKTSDMATVLVQGRDGRHALVAFTGSEALQRWRGDARPVPVTARDAARAARQEGAAALVLDVAGPVPFVVSGDDLQALAEGWHLTRVGDRYAWVQVRPRPGAGEQRGEQWGEQPAG